MIKTILLLYNRIHISETDHFLTYSSNYDWAISFYADMSFFARVSFKYVMKRRKTNAGINFLYRFPTHNKSAANYFEINMKNACTNLFIWKHYLLIKSLWQNKIIAVYATMFLRGICCRTVKMRLQVIYRKGLKLLWTTNTLLW